MSLRSHWLRWGVLALSQVSVGCGYVVGRGSGTVHQLSVSSVTEEAVRLDVAAEVASAVRRQVSRAPSLALAEEASLPRLRVRLLDVGSGFAPLAEPALRAAEYVVWVRIDGELEVEDGTAVWRSPPLEGRARFMSTAGRIETLDGADRRALRQAAEMAAERLVYAVTLQLEASRSSESTPP
jgi:hypothetical protein